MSSLIHDGPLRRSCYGRARSVPCPERVTRVFDRIEPCSFCKLLHDSCDIGPRYRRKSRRRG